MRFGNLCAEKHSKTLLLISLRRVAVQPLAVPLHREGKIRPLMSTSSQGLGFGNGISFGYFLFPSLCYFCIFILFLSWRVFQTLDPIFSFLNFSNIRSSHPGCLPWVSVSFLLVCGAGREENCFQAKQQCHSGDHLAGCAAWEWIIACNP